MSIPTTQPTNSCFPVVMYPFLMQPSMVLQSSALPGVVPASGTNVVTTEEQRTTKAEEQRSAEAHLTTYPSKEAGVVYTYASYGEELSGNVFKYSLDCSWTFSLAIPTPSNITNPTLTSLTYIIKYATTHDSGDSTVQADIVLTTASCPVGILTDPTDLGIYRNGPRYGPRMVDNSKAMCLSSTPAIKCNNGGTRWTQWSHYIDSGRLVPSVRIVGSANLYLIFHVFEYPTEDTLRRLAIEVSVTWSDPEGKKAAKEKAAKKEAEEAAINAAPAVADEAMQNLIETNVLELKMEKCPKGFAWNKISTGYQCTGKGHKITFEELGMRSS